jgi:DNA invertase Pin-like site-specific DNA recombinase
MTTTKQINKVAIYYRVSKDTQVKDDTIENQRQNLPKFATDQGWEIVREFEDAGRSGTSLLERPRFNELLERVRAGDYDAVLVRHSDRITRTEDWEEIGKIMGAFQKSGTLIASPYEGVADVTSFAGKLTEFTKALMAAEENKKRNERVQETKQRSLDAGVYRQSGYDAYGYSLVSGAKGQPPKIVQHEAEAEVLWEVWRLLVEEKRSVTSVCKELNDVRKIRGKRGGIWRPTTLLYLLRNTNLYGEIVANRWKQVKHEKTGKRVMVERPREEWKIAYIDDPIFTREEWDLLQEAINRRQPRGREPVLEGRYLCRGLLECDICGGSYTTYNGGSKADRGKWYYYACQNKRNSDNRVFSGKKVCRQSPNVRQELLDQAVWLEVVEILSEPGEILQEWFTRPKTKLLDTENEELAQIDEQVKDYRKKIRYWLDRGEKGTEIEYIEGKINHYEGLIAVAEEKKERIKERKRIAEAQRRKEEQVKEGARRLLETLESKVEIKDTDNDIIRWLDEWAPKQEVITRMLMGLDFKAKRKLLEAIVGPERIKVMQGEKHWKVHPSWSKRPIKADFQLGLQGILDVEGIIKALNSIDKETYLNSLNDVGHC